MIIICMLYIFSTLEISIINTKETNCFKNYILLLCTILTQQQILMESKLKYQL